MVDPARVRTLLAAAEAYLDDVTRLRDAVGRDRFLADRTEQYRIEFPLQQLIQVSIDLAAHANAERPGPRPDSLAGLFRALAERGSVPVDLAERLTAMARFRNLLVHGYVAIRPELVWDILTDGSLDDIRAFLARVAADLEP